MRRQIVCTVAAYLTCTFAVAQDSPRRPQVTNDADRPAVFRLSEPPSFHSLISPTDSSAQLSRLAGPVGLAPSSQFVAPDVKQFQSNRYFGGLDATKVHSLLSKPDAKQPIEADSSLRPFSLNPGLQTSSLLSERSAEHFFAPSTLKMPETVHQFANDPVGREFSTPPFKRPEKFNQLIDRK